MFEPRRFPPPLLPVLGLVPLLAGCIQEKGGAGPTIKAEIVVRLVPQLDPTLANTQESRKLIRLKHRILDANTLAILSEGPVGLDADQPELDATADISIEVDVAADLDIRGQVWLLGDQEEIEWSGRFNPVPVSDDPKVTVWPIEIVMGRGDLPDQTVEAITVAGLDHPLGVGESVDLVATVQGGPANAAVFWGSSNPAAATVDANGRVTGVAPGTSTVSVVAGLRVDSTVVTVSEEP